MTGVVTPQNLLDAMDGVCLLLDGELRILAVGWPNWDRFLRENDGPDYQREQVLGRRIHDFFTEGEVRDTYKRVFEHVLTGRRGELQVTYHCDAPQVERLMRLSVTRVEGERGAALLYQSTLLSATERPPMGLFGAPVRPSGQENLLTICSICARVAWPEGAPAEAREWISPHEYYRRGGGEVAALSHGFCPKCFDDLMAQMN